MEKGKRKGEKKKRKRGKEKKKRGKRREIDQILFQNLKRNLPFFQISRQIIPLEDEDLLRN